jgi:alkylhydroperoxidase family enzyme
MPYIEVISPESAVGRLAEVYEEIAGSRGRIDNFWQAQSLDPEFLRSHVQINAATMKKATGLSLLEREAVATTVAAANECPY